MELDVVVSAISEKWLFQIFCRQTVYQGVEEVECRNSVLSSVNESCNDERGAAVA